MPDPTASPAAEPTGTHATDTDAAAATITGGGVTVPWKLVLPLLGALVIGGGTAGGFQLATKGYVDGCEKAATQASIDRDAKIEQKVDKQAETIKAVEVQGLKLAKTVGEIQSVQHDQFASQEARRVTESIPNRQRREREYERLLRRNRERLKRGVEPCANVDCSN